MDKIMKYLKKMLGIYAISLIWLVSASMAIAATPNSDGTINCSYATDFAWVNSEGRTEVGQAQEGRWLKQYFYWKNNAYLKWFRDNPDSTFEVDTVFYNYKWTAYAKSFSGLIDSNLPRYYVDTQFSDNPQENNVGMGSASAKDLRPQRLYYYWGILESDGGPPNQDPDSGVKVIAQRGLRSPSNCYRAGCSFGCKSNGKHVQIPFQSNSLHPKKLLAPNCRLYYNKPRAWWDPNTLVSYSRECPDWNG